MEYFVNNELISFLLGLIFLIDYLILMFNFVEKVFCKLIWVNVDLVLKFDFFKFVLFWYIFVLDFVDKIFLIFFV